MLLSALCLFYLSIGSLAVTGPYDDNSGYCLEPIPRIKGNRKYCNAGGTLQNPPPSPAQFVAYDAQECAQRCYDQYTPCASFSFDPAAAEGDENCSLYDMKLTRMGFTRSKNSSVKYSAAFCYSHTAIEDAPIQDGDFSEYNQQVWEGGFYDGKGHAGEDPATSPSDYGSSEAGIRAFSEYSTDPRREYSRYSAGNYLQQTVKTCPGMTYSLTFSESSITYAYYADPSFLFYTTINGQNVDVESHTTNGTEERHEVGPYYFMPSGASATVKFIVPIPAPLPSGTPAGPSEREEFLELLTNVVVQSVYRGALPSGTKVYNV